jgi:hypothetical protein
MVFSYDVPVCLWYSGGPSMQYSASDVTLCFCLPYAGHNHCASLEKGLVQTMVANKLS